MSDVDVPFTRAPHGLDDILPVVMRHRINATGAYVSSRPTSAAASPAPAPAADAPPAAASPAPLALADSSLAAGAGTAFVPLAPRSRVRSLATRTQTPVLGLALSHHAHGHSGTNTAYNLGGSVHAHTMSPAASPASAVLPHSFSFTGSPVPDALTASAPAYAASVSAASASASAAAAAPTATATTATLSAPMPMPLHHVQHHAAHGHSHTAHGHRHSAHGRSAAHSHSCLTATTRPWSLHHYQQQHQQQDQQHQQQRQHQQHHQQQHGMQRVSVASIASATSSSSSSSLALPVSAASASASVVASTQAAAAHSHSGTHGHSSPHGHTPAFSNDNPPLASSNSNSNSNNSSSRLSDLSHSAHLARDHAPRLAHSHHSLVHSLTHSRSHNNTGDTSDDSRACSANNALDNGAVAKNTDTASCSGFGSSVLTVNPGAFSRASVRPTVSFSATAAAARAASASANATNAHVAASSNMSSSSSNSGSGSSVSVGGSTALGCCGAAPAAHSNTHSNAESDHSCCDGAHLGSGSNLGQSSRNRCRGGRSRGSNGIGNGNGGGNQSQTRSRSHSRSRSRSHRLGDERDDEDSGSGSGSDSECDCIESVAGSTSKVLGAVSGGAAMSSSDAALAATLPPPRTQTQAQTPMRTQTAQSRNSVASNSIIGSIGSSLAEPRVNTGATTAVAGSGSGSGSGMAGYTGRGGVAASVNSERDGDDVMLMPLQPPVPRAFPRRPLSAATTRAAGSRRHTAGGLGGSIAGDLGEFPNVNAQPQQPEPLQPLQSVQQQPQQQYRPLTTASIAAAAEARGAASSPSSLLLRSPQPSELTSSLAQSLARPLPLQYTVPGRVFSHQGLVSVPPVAPMVPVAPVAAQGGEHSSGRQRSQAGRDAVNAARASLVLTPRAAHAAYLPFPRTITILSATAACAEPPNNDSSDAAPADPANASQASQVPSVSQAPHGVPMRVQARVQGLEVLDVVTATGARAAALALVQSMALYDIHAATAVATPMAAPGGDRARHAVPATAAAATATAAAAAFDARRESARQLYSGSVVPPSWVDASSNLDGNAIADLGLVVADNNGAAARVNVAHAGAVGAEPTAACPEDCDSPVLGARMRDGAGSAAASPARLATDGRPTNGAVNGSRGSVPEGVPQSNSGIVGFGLGLGLGNNAHSRHSAVQTRGHRHSLGIDASAAALLDVSQLQTAAAGQRQQRAQSLLSASTTPTRLHSHTHGPLGAHGQFPSTDMFAAATAASTAVAAVAAARRAAADAIAAATVAARESALHQQQQHQRQSTVSLTSVRSGSYSALTAASASAPMAQSMVDDDDDEYDYAVDDNARRHGFDVGTSAAATATAAANAMAVAEAAAEAVVAAQAAVANAEAAAEAEEELGWEARMLSGLLSPLALRSSLDQRPLAMQQQLSHSSLGRPLQLQHEDAGSITGGSVVGSTAPAPSTPFMSGRHSVHASIAPAYDDDDDANASASASVASPCAAASLPTLPFPLAPRGRCADCGAASATSWRFSLHPVTIHSRITAAAAAVATRAASSGVAPPPALLSDAGDCAYARLRLPAPALPPAQRRALLALPAAMDLAATYSRAAATASAIAAAAAAAESPSRARAMADNRESALAHAIFYTGGGNTGAASSAGSHSRSRSHDRYSSNGNPGASVAAGIKTAASQSVEMADSGYADAGPVEESGGATANDLAAAGAGVGSVPGPLHELSPASSAAASAACLSRPPQSPSVYPCDEVDDLPDVALRALLRSIVRTARSARGDDDSGASDGNTAATAINAGVDGASNGVHDGYMCERNKIVELVDPLGGFVLELSGGDLSRIPQSLLNGKGTNSHPGLSGAGHVSDSPALSSSSAEGAVPAGAKEEELSGFGIGGCLTARAGPLPRRFLVVTREIVFADGSAAPYDEEEFCSQATLLGPRPAASCPYMPSRRHTKSSKFNAVSIDSGSTTSAPGGIPEH